MAKDDELDKAHGRGQELTVTEIALEEARDAFHADRNDETKDAFKEAQQAVADARVSERLTREAEGPPADAVEVVRDAVGKAVGWNTPEGDLVVSPGGVA
jgi:hypothetical protein